MPHSRTPQRGSSAPNHQAAGAHSTLTPSAARKAKRWSPPLRLAIRFQAACSTAAMSTSTSAWTGMADCGRSYSGAMTTNNPVLVEAWRGPMVESFHRGAWAVVDGAGTLVASDGDVEQPVYPRSAIKLLQALPLVASGAADRFGLSDAELAL